MNLRNNKGYTGVDISVAMIIILIFIPTIFAVVNSIRPALVVTDTLEPVTLLTCGLVYRSLHSTFHELAHALDSFEVNISRDGGGGILYTYGGSAIVTYPVSSGSYVGAVQAALSTALGIGSAIATGGASLGASAGMVLGGLANAKTQVQHSGQYGWKKTISDC